VDEMAEEIQSRLVDLNEPENLNKVYERFEGRPKNLLHEIQVDRDGNLYLQVWRNDRLHFALTRIFVDKDKKIKVYSILLSKLQLQLLREKISEGLDAFHKLEVEQKLEDRGY
jgi:hypothetical protein